MSTRVMDLTPEERARLDATLAEGRRWHYVSFWIFALAALFAISNAPEISVPGLGFQVRRDLAGVALFVGVVGPTSLTLRMIISASDALRRDSRSTFPWFILGTDGRPSAPGLVFLLVPILGTAIAAAHCLGGVLFQTFETLTIYGLLVVTAIAFDGLVAGSARLRIYLLLAAFGGVVGLLATIETLRHVMKPWILVLIALSPLPYVALALIDRWQRRTRGR